MFAILAVLIAAAPAYYEAKVMTFGCNSAEEVAELQRLRADENAFGKALYEQVFYGQCVQIEKGKIVEASDAPSALLLVDREVLPPGYLAPKADFEAKTTDAAPAQQPAEPAPAASAPGPSEKKP